MGITHSALRSLTRITPTGHGLNKDVPSLSTDRSFSLASDEPPRIISAIRSPVTIARYITRMVERCRFQFVDLNLDI